MKSVLKSVRNRETKIRKLHEKKKSNEFEIFAKYEE